MAESRNHSRKSSTCSQLSRVSASSAQQTVGSSVVVKQPPTDTLTETLQPQVVPAGRVDPLSREYPKPSENINVAEMLKRKPMKWSLGHYISEAPTRAPTSELPSQVVDKEEVARDLEAKKRELLEAKEQVRNMSLAK